MARESHSEWLRTLINLPVPKRAEWEEVQRLRLQSEQYLRTFADDPLTQLVLDLYAGTGYKDVNSYLRDPVGRADSLHSPLPVYPASEPLARVRKWFDDATWTPTVNTVVRGLRRLIRNAPVTQIPITLYRGVSIDVTQQLDVFQELGVMSASADPSVAAGFTVYGCCLLIIHVPVGTPVLSLQFSLPVSGREDEFLLQPHKQYHVHKITLSEEQTVRLYATAVRRHRRRGAWLRPALTLYTGLVYALMMGHPGPHAHARTEEPIEESELHDPSYVPSEDEQLEDSDDDAEMALIRQEARELQDMSRLTREEQKEGS